MAFIRIPYDLKWIYDTSLSMEESISRLKHIADSKTYCQSNLLCTRLSANQIELVFKQAKGVSRLKCTKYIADFYSIEGGSTAIVLRFINELFFCAPLTSLEEIDKLFEQGICAIRRK